MSAAAVVIVASGGANTASLRYAFERLNVTSTVSADAARIAAATHVILPGVGAAGEAMARLRAAGLDGLIPSLRQPVLGICLGMQLLFDSSAEGEAQCLRLIPGRAERIAPAPGRPVPHTGWNTIEPLRASALLQGIESTDYAYFVHSYALPRCAATTATTHYGHPFSACVERRNFHGVQFHPERSSAMGARLLQNFLALR